MTRLEAHTHELKSFGDQPNVRSCFADGSLVRRLAFQLLQLSTLRMTQEVGVEAFCSIQTSEFKQHS